MARTRYKKPKFPRTTAFMLVDDRGVDDGPFFVSGWAHNGDGVWSYQVDSSPRFLRVTRQRGDEIWTRDGAGAILHYRMVPVEVQT